MRGPSGRKATAPALPRRFLAVSALRTAASGAILRRRRPLPSLRCRVPPSLHLRVLGATDLRALHGEGPADRVLTQPKRLALLAYLALARPRGFHRRDALVARFWPDGGPERGRAALRLALHHLRRSLGEGVLVNRGDDEVGVAPGVLACDAHEFERAAAEGRHADALAVYAGPLLPDFAIEGAPGWDDWVGAERARLARLASAAATALAARAEADEDAEAELRWRRAAAELDPDDEVALRALLVALDAAGSRAAALEAYEAFARRVRARFDAEPSAETVKLVRAIRARAPAPASPPASPPSAGREDGTGPSASPAPASPSTVRPVAGRDEAPPSVALSGEGDKRSGRTGRWRRGRAGIALAAALAVGLAVWAIGGRMGAAPAEAVETRVAVLPFAVRTGPEHAYLGEGMADLLSTRLDGTGDLTTVDPFALVSFLRGAGGDPTGLEAGRAASGRFHAGRFVLGTVIAAGGRLHLSAVLYGADGRRQARAEVAELREDSLFAGVDALVRSLAAQSMASPPEELDRTAALTTTSLPALKAYLAGERAFRKGAFRRAAESFAQAARGDTGFALASYRLSVAQDWAALDGSDAAARALRLSHRLPAAHRELLRARLAFRSGDAAAAERILRALLATRRDHVEAWHELGEVLYHRAMWQGRPVTAARPAWENVLALDPGNVNARLHLAHLAALAGDGARVDALVTDIERLSPGHEGIRRLRTLRAFAVGDTAAQSAAIDSLRAQVPRDGNDLPAWGAAWRAADFRVDPAAGFRVAAPMVEPGRPAQSRLLGHTTRAHMEAARGRWRSARAQVDSAAAVDADYAARAWAFLVAFTPDAVSPAAANEAYRRLAATSIPRGRGTGGPWDEERGRYPNARHAYVLGALAVRAGHGDAAERHAAELRKMEDTTANGRFAAHLRHQLRARVLAAAGDSLGALRVVEAGWPRAVPELFVKDDSYSTVADRYLRARLLDAAGRRAEALSWYGSLTEDISRGILFPVAADRDVARLLSREGRGAEAEAARARYARNRHDADRGPILP